jgi:hypothetical protein
MDLTVALRGELECRDTRGCRGCPAVYSILFYSIELIFPATTQSELCSSFTLNNRYYSIGFPIGELTKGFLTLLLCRLDTLARYLP